MIVPDTFTTKELINFVQSRFEELADPEKAGPMASYMKTTMPFYGIQKTERNRVNREIKKRFVPKDRRQYHTIIKALWKLPYREEKYTSIEYAKQSDEFISLESLPVFELMIRQGQWWDFVDDIAIKLVGRVLYKDRKKMKPILDRWIVDDDLWIRRTAIISQIHHKKETDQEQLFRYCLKCIDEKDFFIRKAIGWALRDFSKTDEKPVKQFLIKHKDQLSGLSFREGSKYVTDLE